MQIRKLTSCNSRRASNLVATADITALVAKLMEEIESGGDDKIIELSRRFDGFEPRWIGLRPFNEYRLERSLRDSISAAANRIEFFCQFQKEQYQDRYFEDEVGSFGYCYKPVKRIGAYIPGGRYPLISSALMTLIPATVAGVSQRIACSPSKHPAILAAASLAGATRFLHIGGVQAIAAMGLGFCESDPVDMLVGPGNQYVNAAKQYLQGRLAVDTAAGPSELLILAEDSTHGEWLIADMAAQAEHDPQAISLLVSDSKALLDKVLVMIKRDKHLSHLYKTEQINLLQATDIEQMIKFSDDFSPEHLLLADSRINPDLLNHYGAIFIGENSAVAYGDYCSGPNHTLPTAGAARYSSGLSVANFLKIQTQQKVSDDGRTQLAQIAENLAQAEQLVWHQRSMQVRSKAS
ncbi:histidinol dehydrogenase [Kangiella sp. TOML190]|uniref:histidinol dehydrogenase n=1 Tax=Kangiella sp. TOML190 TaxID=2931351 RepID=UPI00203EA3A8|nr:histidinol dehydrogenase [Kangiella sp. TOML190]